MTATPWILFHHFGRVDADVIVRMQEVAVDSNSQLGRKLEKGEGGHVVLVNLIRSVARSEKERRYWMVMTYDVGAQSSEHSPMANGSNAPIVCLPGNAFSTS